MPIRPASADEVERVRSIERASATRFLTIDMPEIAADEPTDAATLLRRISSGGLLVSEDAGEAVASVMFRPVDGCAYIEQIDVLPAYAGQRRGAALLDEVAALARARGWPALLLSTFREVPWNAPYYRRLGFVDLPDTALPAALLAIRREHVARGLDESRRLFMRRAVA